MKWASFWVVVIACLMYHSMLYAGGKLLATPGVSQLEGSGGGGIVPWAQLSGYATEDEWSLGAFCSGAKLQDYQLDVCGAQVNFFDRLELSVAEQNFTVAVSNRVIEQSVLGAKIRLYGDVIYSDWPQLSVGLMHKSLGDSAIARALGADASQGNDVYFSASKLHLGALYGRNWFWNITARYTQANQIGLLGFGGKYASKRWHIEMSSAVFVAPQLALGFEFREKPHNLGLGESHWRNLFIAWFPMKSLNVTAAWLDLGSIAGVPSQEGLYLSLAGNF
ncbi:DUF3034 family protein [Pseudoalteromonas sp. MMG013]|uniref:DUF3034 family protein n=1 Tax=unclassified Pseudoalteromonas TaxID=194690 RepID=UPI001B39A9B7|nr:MULTISPECIES: DUF3034 family protein [unclassified Pseudoalteromonas]MBQ4846461.1 DUF3034 family protein [Pseudoalteromonas sp. MMG005]MBQ4862306.1 DUF3034 family protein [Pseudoalteromonas sp. MMG013]